ncbi:hypothetical protein SPRG_19988 [Saprolegnia parasitica CBS 223.65]|uniref:3'-phosphate/5'-hydroxy nucleic acid ligase n=2 Tax=Saprolegnia parasitica (strain CBS 223.65) TaxID=695850 RepID=A0A067CPP8_SAPPC|nr:hypothetical protein SPRG_19988 [Saprolegnia parasitica CBS 223.65]KDO28777.1 hypothetical protein SPRG_19988 [Saprolegnia parasitica CBS 223.65]|eukprot:XP_012200519.1 hypothetical protein SPRG_19988 [Saprolegnia parasitica CBS 223.65]
MFTIGQAPNDAVVFLEKDHLDRETLKQIEAIAAHASVAHARIMPDAHKGNGCCVGFTCHLTPTVLPGLIGGDIGCGVALHPLPSSAIVKKQSLARLDRIIQEVVPMGNGHDRVHATPVIAPAQYAPFFAQAQVDAVAFVDAFGAKFQLDLTPHMPTYNDAYLRDLCARTRSDYDYDLCALGTLGGGNHFIEVNVCEATEDVYVAVHTGSRNIGQKIARYHYEQAAGGDAPQQTLGQSDDDVTGVQPQRGALAGAAAAAYFFDMIWAQTYARMNRRAILSLVLAHATTATYDATRVIESTHNYIDFRDLVVRKGAIRCHANELCVVALNMRDGILLCRGRGNAAWNYSGPHGCGRLRARKRAGAAQKGHGVAAAMRGFVAEMGDVYSTCVVPATLDERPSAYRDADLISSALAPTADIVAHARTVLNVKGH